MPDNFLDDLMLRDKIIDEKFLKLPDDLDFKQDKLNIEYDNDKESSYLFYVDPPITDNIGYHDDLGVFVIKGTPHTINCAKNAEMREDAQQYLDLNSIDGDTMSFDIETLIDTKTDFSIGQKHYSSFKDFLNKNGQKKLVLRLLGIDAPEIPHYFYCSLSKDEKKQKLKDVTFDKVILNLDTYNVLNLKHEPQDIIHFLFVSGQYHEIISETPYDTHTLYKVIGYNETLQQPETYLEEGLKVRDLFISLLDRAEDLRIVLDARALNRKSNTYSSPYSRYKVLTANGEMSTIQAFAKATLESFFGEKAYKYMGYNAPGQDSHGRQLGALYIKMRVPELGCDASGKPILTWINVAKYLLYHFDTFTKACPEYSSNPTEAFHNNYFSPSFKLYSYDKRRIEALDRFLTQTDDMIEQRNLIFEELTGFKMEYLKERTVILGDAVFTVPPINIRMVNQTRHTRVSLLRGKGNAVKSLPHSQKIIELDIYFNEAEGINGYPCPMTLPNDERTVYYMNGLRSLIAMFKLTPFLPIENNYINNQLDVDAVSLLNLSVKTMENYPRCLKATLTLSEFNYSIYMPDLPESSTENTFARSIHFPVMRWYYQRLLQKGDRIQSLDFQDEEYIKASYGDNCALIPMHFTSSRAKFFVPDSLQLQRRLEVINDTRPVYTQEQFTESMKQGIVKLKKLKEKLLSMFTNADLQNAVDTLFRSEDAYFPNGIWASTAWGIPAENVNYAPLFSVVYDGGYPDPFPIYPSGVNYPRIRKTALIYKIEEASKEWIYEMPMLTDIPDDIKAVATNELMVVGELIQKHFGEYGGIQLNEGLVSGNSNKGQSLIWSILIPLPIELRQNDYELQVLIRNLMTELGLTETEVQKIVTYNTTGVPCFSFDLNFSLNKISSQFKPDTLYEILDYFQYDFSGLTYKFIDYLSSFVNEEGKYEGTLDSALQEELLNEKKDLVKNESNVLKFIEYPCGDLLIEQIAIDYGNTFSNMSLKMLDGVAFQYCGGQDMTLQLSIVTGDPETVTALSMLPEQSAYYARHYKRVLNCWPLRIQCELSQLFGIHEVLIDNVQTSTIPDQPGLTRLVLTLFAVDRTVRRKEALKKIETGSNAGSIQLGSKSSLELKNYFDLKSTLAKAEIYPDLELPKVIELEEAGFKLFGQTSIEGAPRTYVDPDFYFVYGYTISSEIFQKNFMEVFEKLKFNYDITDTEGAYTKLFLHNTEEAKLENINTLAITQRAFFTMDENQKYDYQDLSTELIQNLNKREKNVAKLAEVVGTLGTPIWYFTESAKLPFRETEYELFPQSTLDTLASKKEEVLKLINEVLEKPIEKMVSQAMFDRGFPKQDDISDYEKTINWTEHIVTETLLDFLRTHKDLLIKGFGLDYVELQKGKEEEQGKEILNYQNAVILTMLAYGDACSGDTYFSNQHVIVDWIDGSKNSTDNWKLCTFLTFGDQNFKKDNNIDINRLVPYAKVQKASKEQSFASSIQEAINAGISFGPFSIKRYPGSEINKFQLSKVNSNYYYFLDPYYQDEKDTETHRYNLLVNPGYCALAAFREFLVLYRHYIEKDLLISIYELVRNEAVEAERKNPDASYTHYELSPEQSLTGKEHELIDSFLKVLTLIMNHHIPDKEERKVLAYEKMKLTEDHRIARAILEDYRNDKAAARELEKLAEDFKTQLDEAKKENESSEKIARLSVLYNICSNYEAVDATAFAYEVFDIISYYETQSALTQDLALETLKMVQEDGAKIIMGKIIGLSFASLDPQLVQPLILEKDVTRLNQLIQIAHSPSINQEYSRIRKFIYALEGRGIIDVAKMGSIPQTLEMKIRNNIFERLYVERSFNPRLYLKDSFLDMIRNDKRGRMLRAFPTYYMFFIDEGREVGLWKLHDNFYGSSAIAEIEVTKSRKIAADTAHITLTNLFNSYSENDKELVDDLDDTEYLELRYKTQDAFKALFSPRTYFIEAEQERLNTLEATSATIQPGTRIHVRMGYGANAAELPIVFNGQIAEVSAGEVIELVAQGDGAELLNPIQEHDDITDMQNDGHFILARIFENWSSQGASPKTILSTLLTTEGTWANKMIRQFSKGFLNNRHPYGIMHFGDIYYRDIFQSGEPTQNLFECYSRAIYENNESQNVGLEAQYRTKDIPRISMHALGLNFWDILHICTSIAPEYMCSIVPFELRSSIFMGAGRHYYAYEYTKLKDSANVEYIAEKRKPFEQYHYYNSFTDIIQNNIVTSTKDIRTTAVGLYSETGWFGNERAKQTETLYADFDIYPEFQKAMTVNTQLWAQGLPVLGNMFGFVADTNKDPGGILPGAKEIAWRMTASALKDSMKDMYQGELIIMGDSTVKPFDRMMIQDLYEEMQGGASVEAVVHSFNAQTGFTTSVFADCINVVDDRYEKENDLLVRSAVYTASAAYLPGVLMNQLFFRKSMKLMNAAVRKYIVKGGMKLAGSDSVTNTLQMLFALMGKELEDADAEIIINSIRVGNTLTEPVNPLAALKNISNVIDDYSSYVYNLGEDLGKRINVSKILKTVFSTENKTTFYETLIHPFVNIDKKLIDLNSAKNVTELIAALKNNRYALEELEKSGESISKLINNLPGSINQNEVQIKELQALLKGYNNGVNDSIKITFSINSSGRDALTDLWIHILPNVEATMPLGSAERELFNVIGNCAAEKFFISNTSDLKKFTSALETCSKYCDDPKILAKLTKVLDNGSDIKSLVGVIKTIDNIEDLKTVLFALSGLGGPIGVVSAILWTAAEMIISAVIGGYATEWIERYLQNLQVLRIYPLSKRGRVMVAGINGHKGMVVGSPTENVQGDWTTFITNLFGAKEPDSFITYIIQNFFTSERAKNIAMKYRTTNGMPNPLGSGFDEEGMKNAFHQDANKRMLELSTKDENYLLKLDRYETLEASKDKIENYVAKSKNGNGDTFSASMSSSFLPIYSEPSLKRYNESGVFSLFHDISGQMTTMPYVLNGETWSLNYYLEDDIHRNVPLLRRETLIVLKNLIYTYIDLTGLNYQCEDLKEKIQDYALILTSATIIDDGTYDATGYAFRITCNYPDILQEASNKLAASLNKKTKQVYIKRNHNEMVITLLIPK